MQQYLQKQMYQTIPTKVLRKSPPVSVCKKQELNRGKQEGQGLILPQTRRTKPQISLITC